MLTDRSELDAAQAGPGERLRRRLGRVTVGRQFIPVVDGLRFVAIAGVVGYHLYDYLTTKSSAVAPARDGGLVDLLLRSGHVGVPLFFVLSGFLLSLPFAGARVEGGPAVNLRAYYLRRLTRLEPPYLINLAVCFVLLAVVRSVPSAELAPHFVASAAYVHNLTFGEASRINFVAWSLEIEAQFYLVMPALAGLFAFHRAPVRRAVVVVAAVAAGAASVGVERWLGGPVRANLLPFLPLFLTGFLLADVYLASRCRAAKPLAWADLVALAGAAGMIACAQTPQGRLLLPVAVFALVWGAFRGWWANWLLSRPWPVTIGGMCYTIYLYHFFAISALGRLTTDWSVPGGPWANVVFQFALLLPPVLVLAAVLFLLFEKPFMRPDWPRRALSAARRPRVRPTAA